MEIKFIVEDLVSIFEAKYKSYYTPLLNLEQNQIDAWTPTYIACLKAVENKQEITSKEIKELTGYKWEWDYLSEEAKIGFNNIAAFINGIINGTMKYTVTGYIHDLFTNEEIKEIDIREKAVEMFSIFSKAMIEQSVNYCVNFNDLDKRNKAAWLALAKHEFEKDI